MRTSASELSAFVKSARPRSEPNDFLRRFIFPHGNVSEHEALVHLKRVYADLHGQSHFARFVDHGMHRDDLESLIASMEVDVRYANRIGSRHVKDELNHAKRIMNALKFSKTEGDKWWMKAKSSSGSYKLPNGITYDVGRRTKQVGDVTVVCQADGLCENDKTVVEIKSPFGRPYTERTDWRHYLIQLAVEVDLYEADHGLLVMYVGPNIRNKKRPVSIKSIRLSRGDLTPLIDSIQAMLEWLSGRPGTSLYERFDPSYMGIANVRSEMNKLSTHWTSVERMEGESKGDIDGPPSEKINVDVPPPGKKIKLTHVMKHLTGGLTATDSPDADSHDAPYEHTHTREDPPHAS